MKGLKSNPFRTEKLKPNVKAIETEDIIILHRAKILYVMIQNSTLSTTVVNNTNNRSLKDIPQFREVLFDCEIQSWLSDSQTHQVHLPKYIRLEAIRFHVNEEAENYLKNAASGMTHTDLYSMPCMSDNYHLKLPLHLTNCKRPGKKQCKSNIRMPINYSIFPTLREIEEKI